MVQTLYYVTSNAGKFEEVEQCIRAHELPITLLRFDADIEEIQTMNQEEIAIDKALKAWTLLKKPLLVDDSGIYFEKYHEFPGVMSKYISHGIGMAGIMKLIEPGDRAYFRLHLVFVDTEGIPHSFEGLCKGYLVIPAVLQAHADLPYDDIFVPDELAGEPQTYAQLRGTSQFEQFSYRLRALNKFLTWMAEQGKKK